MGGEPPARDRNHRPGWAFLVPLLISIAAMVFAAAGMWETTFVRQELSLPQYAVILAGYGAIGFAVPWAAIRVAMGLASARQR